LLLLVVAGCHDPLTEVVLVLESDLAIPAEVDTLQMGIAAGPTAPMVGNFQTVPTQFFLTGNFFPLSVGFGSAGGTSSFSLTVQLLRSASAIVISRNITDIRFVREQTMMLVVPLLRACACQGTTCPNPGDPDCDNLTSPALQPFDPAVAPPSTMMNSSLPITPNNFGGPVPQRAVGISQSP